MRSKRIYVAGPYTKGDVAQNVHLAIVTAHRLSIKGYVPFIPHLSHFWHMLYPRPIEFWYQYDFAWLEICDCLLRLPGESAGADLEVKRAQELGIPVYWSVETALEQHPFISKEYERDT